MVWEWERLLLYTTGSAIYTQYFVYTEIVWEGERLFLYTTEYTELQSLLSGVHSVMRVKLALAVEGGGYTPTPSYYIYHH
jgi:hypothetical protein